MTINERVSDERLSTLANLQSHECMALPAGHNEIALAALESRTDAEPYGYVHKAAYEQCGSSGLSNDHEGLAGSPDHIPLYTRPQPAPVVVHVPPAQVSDSLLSELLALAKKAADEADECAHAEFSDDSIKHSTAIADWERRAAMLQGKAEPVSQPYTLPDGYVLVPVEMTPEQMRAIQLESELGAYAAENLSGAYSLFRELWYVAVTAALRPDIK